MIGPILAGVAALLITCLTPAVLLAPIKAEAPPPKLLVIEPDVRGQKEVEIRLQTGQAVQTMALEDYLIGVVLSEMPISFEQEALKAQAVAARTFALRQLESGKHSDFDLCGQSSCCQAWAGEAALAKKLGDSWRMYWDKAANAVDSTAGQVLTYDDELIEAVYFSCSGGSTEDAVAVWGGEVPYLQSVESPGEEQAGKFRSQNVFSREAFCAAILQEQPLADFSGSVESWLGPVEYTQGGGVEKMTIGGCEFTGTELRRIFGLNSTNFTLKADEGQLTFSVLGYGHRVGMSQYGANAMAANGNSYKQILTHYYKGVKIEKWP